jgi:hypothetical protein
MSKKLWMTRSAPSVDRFEIEIAGGRVRRWKAASGEQRERGLKVFKRHAETARGH